MGILKRIIAIFRAEINSRASTVDTASDHFDGDDHELRRIIEELNRTQAKQQSPKPSGTVEWAYRTLGITPSASNDQIKAAYRRAISQTHPDRFARASEEQQRLAARRAQEINRAYAFLKAVRKF